MKHLLLLGTVVEKMHAHANIDAHGFKALLSGLTVNNVVAHVKFCLQARYGR
jgi:hypothetical protein